MLAKARGKPLIAWAIDAALDAELDELVVRCPKCHSAEVVFEGGTATPVVAGDDSSQKYRWGCESCGGRWEDDGVAEEE